MNRGRSKAPTRATEDWETVAIFGTRARVSWCPQSRSYCLEIDDSFISAPNRPDIVKALAEHGIEWKPWEVSIK